MSQFNDFDLDIDLTNVQDWAGTGNQLPAVPPGDYVVDITNVVRGTSKTQNPKIDVDFSVVDGDYAGQTLKGIYSLKDTAVGRFKRLCLATGMSDFARIKGSDLMGARIQISVFHEEGQATIGANGQPLPSRTFLKVANERPLDLVEAPPPPPPATRKPAAGAVRRA